MIAIQTKYLSPTNSRGARIKAFTERNSVTISYPYASGGAYCHVEAVKELLRKHPFAFEVTHLVYGELPHGGYAFCFPESVIKLQNKEKTS